MFDLCLFDLDDTLVLTADLKEVREACKNNSDPARLEQLVANLAALVERRIYSLKTLQQIRVEFPALKLGIFTRSPRSYALAVLNWAYPGFNWDIVVAYEDVKLTKPRGNGIHKAMDAFGFQYLDRVILVGDSDVDVRAAYHGGSVVTLDKGAWPHQREFEHWRALEHIPDAVIQSPDEILDVLRSPGRFLPELERLLGGGDLPLGDRRYDRINHFVAKAAGGDHTPFPIYVCGRSFANYESLHLRKKWHRLTASIEDHKDADIFPDEWIEAIRQFIKGQYPFYTTANVVVAVIPHRPGRKPRLEKLLVQLKQSFDEQPLKGRKINFEPDLLAYRPGVKSQHNDYLGRDERFINVRDHLFVQKPELVAPGVSFLIIDDVTTTGASLIFASKYLQMAGAANVKCLSMAKNIGDVL